MSLESLNGTLGELLESFSDKRWEAEGEGTVILKSDDEKHYIIYTNNDQGPDSGYQEISLWENGESWDTGGLMFKLEQEVEDDEVGYRISVPPFTDQYWNQYTGRSGVVYNFRGEMEPVRRVKGLPRKIDMNKTVELFLKQIIEKDFSKPVLVKMDGK